MFYSVVLVGCLVILPNMFSVRGGLKLKKEWSIDIKIYHCKSDDSSLMIAINVCCLEIKKKHRKEPRNAAVGLCLPIRRVRRGSLSGFHC